MDNNQWIEALKFVTGDKWVNYQNFLRANPIVATFSWSDLCNQYEKDMVEGKHFWQDSVARWKIYHHSQFRVEMHKHFHKNLKAQVKLKLDKKLHILRQTDPQLTYTKISQHWQDHYPTIWEAQRKFDQWYGKIVSRLYKVQFPLTGAKKLKDVAIEFGFRETNTQNWQNEKDSTEKPVDVHDPGDKQKGKTIRYHQDAPH